MTSAHHSFPWGAVYRADNKGFVANPTEPVFGRSTPWKLFSAKVSLTRLWAASSAQFTLTRRILSAADRKLNLAEELDLAPEDPIVIDMGYANALFSDTNLLHRKRVFFGYVDTINVKVGPKGVKVTVSCRDSMRFLIENKFSGEIFGQNWHINQSTSAGTAREQEDQLSLAEVAEAMGIPANTFSTGSLDKHKIIGWLIYAGSNGGCLPGTLVEKYKYGDEEYKTVGGATRSLSQAAIEITTRPTTPPEDVDGGVVNFNIMNRFPLEVIKHLASLEAEPRELFAEIGDNENGGGKISWKTRYTEGFDSPYVLSYLIPATVNGQTYEPNVLSGEIDWSTIGTISELIVINPQAQTNTSGGAALPTAGVLSVSGRLPDDRFFPDAISAAFPGLRSFTRRTRYIFDDTIRGDDLTNALGVIDAMFRIWGKDVRAGTAVIQGDETIRPGLAVQIFNFGYFDEEVFRAEAVTHQIVAQGPSKGFKTAISFAEADENKQDSLDKVKGLLKDQYAKDETKHHIVLNSVGETLSTTGEKN